MGWIAPWDGLSGPEAALEAEDPLRWPPAGPATDPSFDNEVLAPLIRSYDAADPTTAAQGGRWPRWSRRCGRSWSRRGG